MHKFIAIAVGTAALAVCGLAFAFALLTKGVEQAYEAFEFTDWEDDDLWSEFDYYASEPQS